MAKIQPCPVKMRPHIYAALVFFTQLRKKRVGDTLTDLLEDLWLCGNNSVGMIEWAFETSHKTDEEKIYRFVQELEDKYGKSKKWPSERTLNNVFLQDEYYKKMKENRIARRTKG